MNNIIIFKYQKNLYFQLFFFYFYFNLNQNLFLKEKLNFKINYLTII